MKLIQMVSCGMMLLGSLSSFAQRDTSSIDLGGESVSTSFRIRSLPSVINQQQWTRAIQNLDLIVLESPLEFAGESQRLGLSSPYTKLPVHQIAADYAELQRYFLFRGYAEPVDTAMEARLRTRTFDFDRLAALNYPIVRPRVNRLTGDRNVRFIHLAVDSSRWDSSFAGALELASAKSHLWQQLYAVQNQRDPEHFEPEFSYQRFAFESGPQRRALIANLLFTVKERVDTVLAPMRRDARAQQLALEQAYRDALGAQDTSAMLEVLSAYPLLLAQDPEAARLRRKVVQTIDSLPAGWPRTAALQAATEKIAQFPLARGEVIVMADSHSFSIPVQHLTLAADSLGQTPLTDSLHQQLANYARDLGLTMEPMRQRRADLIHTYDVIQPHLETTEDSLFRWVLRKYEQTLRHTDAMVDQLEQLAQAPAESTNYLQLLLVAENLQQVEQIARDNTGLDQALRWRAKLKEEYVFKLREQEQRFLELRAARN